MCCDDMRRRRTVDERACTIRLPGSGCVIPTIGPCAKVVQSFKSGRGAEFWPEWNATHGCFVLLLHSTASDIRQSTCSTPVQQNPATTSASRTRFCNDIPVVVGEFNVGLTKLMQGAGDAELEASPANLYPFFSTLHSSDH